MSISISLPRHLRTSGWLLVACTAAVLSACGGGGAAPNAAGPADPATNSANATSTDAAAPPVAGADVSLPPEVAAQLAHPAFHLAPLLLDPPTTVDADDNRATARLPAHQQVVPADRAGLRTRGLTVQAIEQAQRQRTLNVTLPASGETAQPLATGSVSTYTPAQIRAAYSLPDLPAAGVTPTAEQAALLGAGQTVYIVDARHDPNAAAELAAFNQRFGLPGCTTRTIAATTSLPLAAASTTEGCSFSVVYSTAAGAMTSSAPPYDANWATEIALDVQWAHATAPLARIVLIEAADASLDALLGGVKLANAMGAGAVSMSFGSDEGSWTSSVDAAFGAAGMTYLAATGDWGTQVSWPSVSTKVLAVGGTRLSYSGSGARSEVAWSQTGGGISAYLATPAYQSSVPGMGALARRTVADVAFNADPASGQYTAVMQPGSSAVNWVSAGGTSLSTPQWAGLIAMTNALRARAGKATIGAAHAALYGQIGGVPGSYAASLLDIDAGSHGSCSTCSARPGYDQLTGLGTPNVADLLRALQGDTGTSSTAAPVVASASIRGFAGLALSYKVSVVASNAVSYALSGAPAGMTISNVGVLAWPKPVRGNYNVGVTARDSKTGLTGQASLSVGVEPVPLAPAVAAATVTGRAGTALSFGVTASAANAVTFTFAGAPAGMTMSAAGEINWPKPVAGSFSVKVTAKDNVTGQTGLGVVTFKIEALPVAPAVTSAKVAGKAGTALKFTVAVKSTSTSRLELSGAPAGLVMSSAGVVTWPIPVAGSYVLTVTATDSKNGLTGQGTITVDIAKVPKAPALTGAALTGVAGRALTGWIGISDDPDSRGISVTVTGVPAGLQLRPEGNGLAIYWPSPVKGKYSVVVTAKNSFGLSSKLAVPVTINAL